MSDVSPTFMLIVLVVAAGGRGSKKLQSYVEDPSDDWGLEATAVVGGKLTRKAKDRASSLIGKGGRKDGFSSCRLGLRWH